MAAGKDEASHGHIARAGEMRHAARRLFQRQAGGAGLRVVVTVNATLVAVARYDPVDGFHKMSFVVGSKGTDTASVRNTLATVYTPAAFGAMHADSGGGYSRAAASSSGGGRGKTSP